MSTSSDEASDVNRGNLSGSVGSSSDVNSRREPFLGQADEVVNLNGTQLDRDHTNSASLKVDRETVRAYLTEMYLDVPGLLQIWSTPEKGSGAFFPTTEEGIDQAVFFINAQWDAAGQQGIYSRVTTLKDRPTKTGSRGFAIDSKSFIALWTDIDFGTTGHAVKGGVLPPDAASAQMIYDDSGLPEASITVHSGGGLYHIVKLAEPLDVTDDEIRMRVAALSRRWQKRVQATAEGMGYAYGTGVSDIARVLRIPGTVNAKEWGNKRPATYRSSGARYTLEELEAACPVPPKPARTTTPTGDASHAADAHARMKQLLDEMRATTFERNNALNRLAYMAFQYAGAGQLDAEEVAREFTDAGLDSGLDDGEVHATVNSARKGLDTPLEWVNYTRARAEAKAQPRDDMWAGELDDNGQVSDRTPVQPSPATPTPVAKTDTPVTAVTSAAQETPAPTIVVETEEVEPDTLLDAADPLVDTRMPRVTGTIRTSSDKKPYSVAQELRDSFFLHNGKPTLMRWQEMWVRWDGACWKMMSNDDVTSWLYQRMDRAFSMKKVDDQWTEVPWNPTNGSVTGLDKALRAAVNLRDDAKQNTMIGEGVHDLAVSCANGLLRVAGRELAPADPAFFTFSSVPFDYDRGAKCPQWEEWLADTFEHDPKTVDMLQEWFAYVISGRTDLQKALMIQGVERSGKSTIARILQKLAGEINCAGTTLNSLTEQFGMWPLTDKTLAVIGDARLPRKGNTETITERLLSIIGEDTIQVDRKMQKPWQGTIPARIMLLSNEFPNWSDSSGVLPTRFIVARTVKSYLGKEDPTLLGRLSEELPGILNWALDGLDRLIANRRFTTNDATPEVVGAQRDRSSPQKGFLEEMCVIGEDKWVSKDRLREMWRFWNSQRGHQVNDTRESFTIKLLAMAPGVKARDQKKRIDGKLTPVYRGIGLLADHPELAPKEEEEPKEETTAPAQGVLPGTETPPDQVTQPPPRPPFPHQTGHATSQNGTKPTEPPASRPPTPQHPDPGEP